MFQSQDQGASLSIVKPFLLYVTLSFVLIVPLPALMLMRLSTSLDVGDFLRGKSFNRDGFAHTISR